MKISVSKKTSIHRIIHIADVHIRLYKRSVEFESQFLRLFDELREMDVTEHDIIVVAGDVVHTKTDMSPEMVGLTSLFFTGLSNIAPTFVIAGNHDFAQNNLSRMDALSPIVNGLNLPNLYYLKESGIYPVGNIELAVFSLFDDPSLWPTADQCKSAHKVALFHGPLYSATTDVGYTVTSRHHEVGMFDGFDMVLLGDIHARQTLQEYDPANGKPIINYVGSLIQQNFGEHVLGHGYNVWDVNSRSFAFHELYNDHGMYTIRVEGTTVPDTSDMPERVRLRIFTGDLSESDIKKYLTTLKSKHTILECAITRPAFSQRSGRALDTTDVLDVHDITYQNKLIQAYISDIKPDASDALVSKIIDINVAMNAQLPPEDMARRVVWVPKSLKFSNLFTYGEDNWINFETLQGSIGIFAPNASGKSSIPDAISFALYDKTPRTIRAVNIMNTSKDSCFCEFVFTIGDDEYTITRVGKRNKKGEVKIDVDFSVVAPNGVKTILNGDERRITNEHIRQYVGDFDDFLLTAFSVQDKNSLFIDRGQSDRKDVLSQFMGLRVFDTLHQLAKDESKEVATMLKQFKHDDFTSKLVDVQTEIDTHTQTLEDYKDELLHHSMSIAECDGALQTAYESRRPVTASHMTIEMMHTKKRERGIILEAQQAKVAKLNAEIAEGPQYEDEVATLDESIATANAHIARGMVTTADNQGWIDANGSDIRDMVRERDVMVTSWRNLTSRKSQLTTEIANYQRQIDVLDTHQYDPACKFCCDNKFVKAAELAKTSIIPLQDELVEVSAQLDTIAAGLAEYTTLDEEVQKLSDITTKLQTQLLALEKLRTRVAEYESQKAKCVVDAEKKIQRLREMVVAEEGAIASVQREIEKFDEMIVERLAQEQDIQFNATVDESIVEMKQNRTRMERERDGIQRQITSLSSQLAVAVSQKQTMLDKLAKAKELEATNLAYDCYLAAMSRDGIPYKLVSEVIPALETDANNILAQLVEFAIMLDVDGKNINARIAYGESHVWPLELASGMERFISSLAIRVALMRISALPKSNFLIIDEGFGALDADNRNSLYMLFEFLKTQFECIFVISHLDSLRDVTDSIIEIKREDRTSQVYVA